MTAGAAQRIFNSVDSREVRIYQKAVSVAAMSTGETANVTKNHKFLSRY